MTVSVQSGPKIQMPTSLSAVFTVDAEGNINGLQQEWAQFFNAVQSLLYVSTRSGPTASRPTSTQPNRFVGMAYFDVQLGLPVFLKTASSNAWVKADGTPA